MHIQICLQKSGMVNTCSDEIEWFIQHLHEIPNEQIGAFLMACQSMAWMLKKQLTSKAMLEQGERLPPRDGGRQTFYRGVGDK